MYNALKEKTVARDFFFSRNTKEIFELQHDRLSMHLREQIRTNRYCIMLAYYF